DNVSGAGSAAQNELSKQTEAPNTENEFREERPEAVEERRVESRERFENGVGPTPLMFTGIQILDPRIFDYIPRGVFSHTVTDTFIPAIARGERIAAHVAEGYWYELSTVRRYLETSIAPLKREGRTSELGDGSRIA